VNTLPQKSDSGRRQRGRKPTGDDCYEELLRRWELDEMARPGLPAKVRIDDFLRKDVPKQCGLLVGKKRQANYQTTFFDALARGRWARAVRVQQVVKRKQRRSLLNESSESIPIRPFGGLVRLVPIIPARLRRRKINSD
jgi:hypothetical protein